jgi:hypothetical protein
MPFFTSRQFYFLPSTSKPQSLGTDDRCNNFRGFVVVDAGGGEGKEPEGGEERHPQGRAKKRKMSCVSSGVMMVELHAPSTQALDI